VNDARLRDAYARILRSREAAGTPAPVSLEAMLAVIERRGSDADRVRTLDAIMQSAEMRSEFEVLRAAAAAAARPAVPRLVYAMAATLVLAAGAGVWLASTTRAPDELRGPGAEPAIALVSPGATIAADAPARFVWRAVPGASAYRLELLDADGTVVYSTRTADSSAVLPPNVTLRRGAEYRWWVKAETPGGEIVTGVPRPLRVQ
jgi:hypothetical protein